MNLLLSLPCQELNSALSFAGHLSDSSSHQALLPTKSDQEKKSTPEHSPPYSCAVAWTPHPVMVLCWELQCAVVNSSSTWSSRRHSPPAPPFLWRMIWLYGMVPRPGHWTSLSHATLLLVGTILLSRTPYIKGQEFISHPTAFPLDNCGNVQSIQQTLLYSVLQHLNTVSDFFPKYFFLLINILRFASAFHWSLLFCMKELGTKMSYISECTLLPWSPPSLSFLFTQSLPSSFMLYKKHGSDFYSRFSIKISPLQAKQLF